MDIVHIIILALIQGVTEFLPISSSGHLILPSEILKWPDQGMEFDVAVHMGTLSAVVVYFWKDIRSIAGAWLTQFGRGAGTDESKLGWYIILATIPAGLTGLLLNDFIETHLRSGTVIAIASIFFGLLLWWGDARSKQNVSIQQMTLTVVLLIGLAQAFALIPGTSRSGVTMTMALFLGLTRVDAARFSFLLSIPIICLSGLYEGVGLLGRSSVDWFAVVVGMFVSGVSAYVCIHYFLGFISKMSMLPFVIYRIVLGVALLGYIYS